MKSLYYLPRYFNDAVGSIRNPRHVNRRVKDYKYVIDKYVYGSEPYFHCDIYVILSNDKFQMYELNSLKYSDGPLEARAANLMSPYYTEYDFKYGKLVGYDYEREDEIKRYCKVKG